MKSRWVQKQDQRILFIDLSNFGKNHREFEEELNQTVSTIGQEMYQQPQHSVLVLVDLTNTSMTSEANHLLSERITDTKKFVRKTAVVGMTGIRGVFLDYFARLAGSETVGFDNVDAAEKWLIESK
ncbi:MAG: hypothetical protein H6634_12420 [Anaerolineales bacterium]|nr:hypothetical protein [Anaerolineales bacterium]